MLPTVILFVSFGMTSLGCVAYRPPPTGAPSAVLTLSEHPTGFVRFDIFHSLDACPGGVRMPWNSEYLGSAELKIHPSRRSIRIPGTGYIRLVYKRAAYYQGRRGEIVLQAEPGSVYVMTENAEMIVIEARAGSLTPIRCDGNTPEPISPELPKHEREARGPTGRWS